MKSIVTVALLALLSSGAVGQKPSSETVLIGGFGPISFLRFSPDGRELVRVCVFGPALLFDTGNYNKARTFPVGLRMVAYNPDGTRIATAEGTDGARVWNSALQGRPAPNDLPNGNRPDAKPMTPGIPLDVREMDTPLKVLQAPSRDSSVRVFWTEFSQDGKHLITTHANGHVKVWNASSWSLEADLALTHREVRAAAFAPDGNSLVIGDNEGTLRLWSFASNAEVKTTRTTLGAVVGVTFSPDGKTLVTTHQSESGSGVMIWNTATWIAVTRPGFGSAAFSKDGKILALGGNRIELIDPSSQKELRTMEFSKIKQPTADTKFPMSVFALAFSPDGGTLAAGFKDGTVILANPKEWD